MPISVVCPGCKKRFNVSDQFAGKKGPCPGCKAIITVPAKAEEVVVHAPEQFGPKDVKGRAVLKPIFRQETKFSPVKMGIIAGVALAVLITTWLLRSPTVSWTILLLGAVGLAPPIALAGYTFLRDDELEPYRGQSLWLRIGLCGLAFAATWGVLWYVEYSLGLDGFELWNLFIIAAAMMIAGGAAAMLALELDFITGVIHYGMYLAATILLRLVLGLDALPINHEAPAKPRTLQKAGAPKNPQPVPAAK